ncbi:hypothetical protein HK104_006205, partial [Borealophlyctis nickersoniae]
MLGQGDAVRPHPDLATISSFSSFQPLTFCKGYTRVKDSHIRLIDVTTLEYIVAHIDDLHKWEFLAISHVWGPGSACKTVDGNSVWELNEAMCASLVRAFTAMKHFGLRYIWMDVLCANQSVPADVGIQFTSMHAIYSKSAICVALNCPDQDAYNCTCDSLATPTENDLATRCLTAERNASMRVKDPLAWAEVPAQMYTAFASANCNADCINSWRFALVNQFASGSWFTRVWTFQEAVMSKKLYIQCGSNYHDWDTLFGRTMLVTLQGTEQWLTMAGILSQIDQSRREYVKNGIISVATVIRMLQQRACRFEADRLYGVAAMCGFNTVIPYDTAASLQDLWTAVRKWAIARGDAGLLVMGACDMDTPGLGATPQLWQGRSPREGMNR